MIERISSGDCLLAIIISDHISEEGCNFLTPDNFSQQLALIKHPAGAKIDPHVHNPVPREVIYTQEVLIIQKGALRVDFFDENRHYLENRVLRSGDVMLIAAGGHGFEVLEEVEMIEVKQGPYAGELDKTRFTSVQYRPN